MQKGQIVRKSGAWYVRLYETVLNQGKPQRVRVLKYICDVTDECRTPGEARKRAAEILTQVNAGNRPQSIESLAEFLEHSYLPYVKTAKKPSTYTSYLCAWRLVEPHLNGQSLRDTHTSDIDRILRAVAGSKQRAKTSLNNVRNFMSGAFRYAIRTDRFSRANPVRESETPKGLKPKSENTRAITLEEIQAQLAVLGEPARTVVLTAALSGLRHSEIRGLRWEDFTGDALYVRRSVWRTHVGDTKTEDSEAPVPVVPILARALAEHKKRARAGYIFQGGTGKPLVLANLARREIRPLLDKAGVPWYGWHSYRRGVGSNLYRLGVPDKVIQAILRHANVTTTQAFYIKTASAESVKAMRALERAFNKSKKRGR
jgi:integrase